MRWMLGLMILWSAVAVAASEPIVGAWNANSYVLADGTELETSGLIFFTDKDWSVLFFVKDASGEVRRGSAEGGPYELDADKLTFSHFYHMSAGEPVASLPASPMRMSVKNAAEAATEPCTVDISKTAMTIRFPSGNLMKFTRSSGP
jgi:hypothetical protein